MENLIKRLIFEIDQFSNGTPVEPKDFQVGKYYTTTEEKGSRRIIFVKSIVKKESLDETVITWEGTYYTENTTIPRSELQEYTVYLSHFYDKEMYRNWVETTKEKWDQILERSDKFPDIVAIDSETLKKVDPKDFVEKGYYVSKGSKKIENFNYIIKINSIDKKFLGNKQINFDFIIFGSDNEIGIRTNSENKIYSLRDFKNAHNFEFYQSDKETWDKVKKYPTNTGELDQELETVVTDEDEKKKKEEKLEKENNKTKIKKEPKEKPKKVKDINLIKKLPIPPVLDSNYCIKKTKEYYNNVYDFINPSRRNPVTIERLGGEQSIINDRNTVEQCYIKFRKNYDESLDKKVNLMRNLAPRYDIFELNFTYSQLQDIYSEMDTMSLKNTIKKVVIEQNQKKKQLIKEEAVVKNKLNFVKSYSHRKNLKRNLLEESKKLISLGFDKNLLREAFADIMSSMEDPATFIINIKTQLGQKIADTVKDKQQEHEMILSAFNQLDSDMIEKAFKENRVDELSQIISQKALENYKSQFGESGIFGSMLASVDEAKFEDEVAKLILPAIEQINNEMESKINSSLSEE